MRCGVEGVGARPRRNREGGVVVAEGRRNRVVGNHVGHLPDFGFRGQLSDFEVYRGNSLIRKHPPRGPYRRPTYT